MALIKKNTDYGFEAEYWRIISVNVDIVSNSAMICIALYANKDAIRYLESRTITVFENKFEKYFSKSNISNYKDIYEASYIYLKENDEYFINSVDDIEEIAKRVKK